MGDRIIASVSLGKWIVSVKVPQMSEETFVWKEAVFGNGGIERVPAYQLTRLPSGRRQQNRGHLFAHFFVPKDFVLGGNMVFECEISERFVRDCTDPEKVLMYYTFSLHSTVEKPTHRVFVGDTLPKFTEQRDDRNILFLGNDGYGDTNRTKIALVDFRSYEAAMNAKIAAQRSSQLRDQDETANTPLSHKLPESEILTHSPFRDRPKEKTKTKLPLPPSSNNSPLSSAPQSTAPRRPHFDVSELFTPPKPRR